jgi:hypothetical protein
MGRRAFRATWITDYPQNDGRIQLTLGQPNGSAQALRLQGSSPVPKLTLSETDGTLPRRTGRGPF